MIQQCEFSQAQIINGILSEGLARERAMAILRDHFLYLPRMGQHRYALTADQASFAYTEALLAVQQNILDGRFQGRSSLSTYLYRIFRNKCYDIRRKGRSAPFGKESLLEQVPDLGADTLARIIARERQAELGRWLQQLSPRARQVLDLFYQEGKSMQEIAGLMGLKNAQVARNLKMKSLQSLRRIARAI